MKLNENLLITSDWHLGHSNIRFHCDRPYDWEVRLWANMHEAREKYPDHTLLNLGDVCFPKYMQRGLSEYWDGPAVCIQGNHDRSKELKVIKAAGWTVVNSYDIIERGLVIQARHRPQDIPHHPQPLVGRRISLYGHLHNTPLWKQEEGNRPSHIRISPEFMGYHPITLVELMKLGETPIWHEPSGCFYGASRYPEEIPVKEFSPNHR